jgi:hypothetical protein
VLALAGALALVTVGLLLDTRRWLRLAGRSRVGARSENAVRGALAALEAEGWRVRHSLPYRGRGDIDSIAIAPTGLAFAIETKTRTFRSEHLANTREMAAWLCRHRRRWCRAGALAVLCVVGARSLERVEDDVLVVSLDRLLTALRVRAGTTPRPKIPRRTGITLLIGAPWRPRVDQSPTDEERSGRSRPPSSDRRKADRLVFRSFGPPSGRGLLAWWTGHVLAGSRRLKKR